MVDITKEEQRIANNMAPKSLSKEARVYWRKLAPELYALGRLQTRYIDQLSTYCQLLVDRDTCRREIEEYGLFYQQDNGVIATNPASTQLNRTIKNIMEYAKLFGLSSYFERMMPESREDAEKDEDGFDDF